MKPKNFKQEFEEMWDEFFGKESRQRGYFVETRTTITETPPPKPNDETSALRRKVKQLQSILRNRGKC